MSLEARIAELEGAIEAQIANNDAVKDTLRELIAALRELGERVAALERAQEPRA